MSGAQGEAEFDESVFDAGDQGEKQPEGAPNDEAAKPDADAKPAPKTQIQDTAAKIGWAGKEDWKGDPGDWIDAPEFILKAAGEVLPSMRKSLEKANEEISGLKKAVKESIQQVSRARQDGYEQRSRELQAELDTAAAAGDVQGVRDATQGIVELEARVKEGQAPADAGPAEPQELTDWKADNPWFGKDKALTAATAAIGDEAVEEGYTGKALIKEVDRRLREQFPAKFAKPENPNRNLPSTVEAPGGARRGGGKSFSDMPRENQDMWADLHKLAPNITKESYAREFFAGEAR